MQGGHRLAACPGALHDHRTRRAQRATQRRIDHPRPVCLSEDRDGVHHPIVALCR
jgi:hypothetical protein